ncbi:YacL family protein [Morganella morganii]|uniref:UPF0231 family protein n=1 Tax=Morganella morganii TaxID=582 RepID=UPI003EB79B92
MDYEFSLGIDGDVIVKLSMDHEAIGHWLNEEVKGDLSVIDEITLAFDSIKGREQQWQRVGHEYTQLMDDEEIMINANQITFETDEPDEGMSYYDNESIAFCGTADFMILLENYRKFIVTGGQG